MQAGTDSFRRSPPVAAPARVDLGRRFVRTRARYSLGLGGRAGPCPLRGLSRRPCSILPVGLHDPAKTTPLDRTIVGSSGPGSGQADGDWSLRRAVRGPRGAYSTGGTDRLPGRVISDSRGRRQGNLSEASGACRGAGIRRGRSRSAADEHPDARGAAEWGASRAPEWERAARRPARATRRRGSGRGSRSASRPCRRSPPLDRCRSAPAAPSFAAAWASSTRVRPRSPPA